MMYFDIIAGTKESLVKFKLRSGLLANSVCKVDGKTSEALDDLDHVDLATGNGSSCEDC